MPKNGPRPTGSIVKGYIEEAVIQTALLENVIAESLGQNLKTLEARMALVSKLAPEVARLSYFVRELIKLCAEGPLEARASNVENSMDIFQGCYVDAIRAENAAQFAKSYGQGLLIVSSLRNELQELETARFENSNMRRL
jgi:hypothetical protein